MRLFVLLIRLESRVKTAVRNGAVRVEQTTTVIKNKAKNVTNTASGAVKDRVISLLPEVSKIQLPEPPFPHLLHSNISPSEVETIDILRVMLEVETQWFRLEEITQGNGPDWITKHEFDCVRQFLHAHRGVLSTIRRVPLELLQEIFILATVRWDTIPWALSQVCRPWRTAALSVSSLWCRLPTIHLNKKTRSYVAQIEELLARSRDAPITFHCIYAPFKELESHPLIDALTLHSERWQTVTIDSTNLSTILAFKGVKGRLSSLRTLTLDIYRHTDPAPVFDMFEDAPQLREVNLDANFPGEIRLPFSQLINYKECVRGRGMTDHTISLATSLTTLDISRFSQSPEIPVITLSLLVTLKVRFDGIPQRGFLDNLTLPAIQEICISGFTGHLITVLTAMISRSRSPCMLKKFSLRSSELDSGELTTLLRLTPHIVDLNLPLPPLEDLTNLIIGPNNRPLVPLLEMLTYEDDDIHRPETSQVLNALAVSRCKLQDGPTAAISQLEEVHLPGDHHRALKELRIIFNSQITCHYELRFLEDWLQSEESEQLEVLKEKLVKELPELEGRQAPRKRRFDLKWAARVYHILSDIEKFEVKNVNDIYISEIHKILRRFTNRPGSTRSAISRFRDKAHEILEKWMPLFESHLKDRRWVLKGEFSLVYLSTDDALWTSQTSSDIVYGMKDNLRFPEIFWNY